jgi:hypothetical protein
VATSFDIIHARAIAKISDYDILKFDDETRKTILDEYLLSAQVEFQRLCKIDLADKNIESRLYNNDLDEEIIEILATGEVYYWLIPKVLNTENLYNVLNTKDFSMYSPANLLKELQSLRDVFWNDFKRKMYMYTYRTANISSLRV